MSLEDNFNQTLTEWKQHCKKNAYHSMARPYLDCKAYKRIVSMGPAILPLIKKEYSKPQGLGDPGMLWCYAIKEIIPEFKLSVGEEGSGAPVERVALGFLGLNVDRVRKATIDWLDGNMSKYVSNS
jgi:hypothetical protein